MKLIAQSFLTLLSVVYASCRLNDITSIVGGKSYSVDHITAAGSDNTIVIAGRYTNSDSSRGFIYKYNLDTCSADPNYMRQFEGMNKGVVNVQINDYKPSGRKEVILLGYNQGDQGSLETVATFDLDNIKETFQILTSPVDKPISQSEEAFQINKYVTQDSVTKVLAISSSQIRLYSPADSTFQIFTCSSTRVAASLSKDYLISVGLGLADTTIAFYSLQSNFALPSFAVSFAQDHGGAAQTKLTAFDDLDQLHVLLALSLHKGSQSATILTYLKTDSAFTTKQINSYGFSQAYKCLFVGTDGMSANLILVDSQNRINLITTSLSNGSVSKQQISSPLTFYMNYSSISPADRVAAIEGWDQYIFGVSDFVLLSGQRFDFERQIGFVMALQKNRSTQLIFDAPLTATNTNTALAFNNVSTDATLALTQTLTSTAFSSQSLPSIFEQKNEWIGSMSDECFEVESSLTSGCSYIELFDKYPLIVSTLKPGIQTAKTNCFDSEILKLKAGVLTGAEKSMRSLCFPNYIEMQNAPIPAGKQSKPMIIVDKEQLRLAWNYLDKELLGNPWIYKIQEYSDDKRFSSNEYAEFIPALVHNTVFKLRQGKFWSYTLTQKLAKPGTFTAKVECLSKVCPDYIKYNPANFTFYSDFKNTNQRVVNATHIYRVNTEFEDNRNMTYSEDMTFMFNVTAVKSKVGINITLPFDEWYALNRKKIKYYSPPTLQANFSNDSTSLQEPAQVIEDFQQSLSIEQKSATSKWTPEQIQKAYEEALQRVSKPVVPIRVTTNFDAFGLLTVKFSSPVSFPSYLIEEANREIQAQGGGNRRLEFADVLFSSSGFMQIQQVAETDFSDQSFANQVDQANLKTSQAGTASNSSDDQSSQANEEDNADANTDQTSQDSANDEAENKNEKDSSNTSDSSGQSDGSSASNDASSFAQQVQEKKEYQENIDHLFEGIDEQAIDSNALIDTESTANTQQACSAAQYFDITKNACIELQIYFGQLNDLFSVFYQTSQAKDFNQQTSIAPYRLVSFSETEIKVQFNFTDPLAITPADKIKIVASFAQFEPGISSNKELEQPCKRQIIPGAGAAVLAAVGKASTAATTATVVGSAILQTVVSGCLAQIWGMINGMQFIMNLPAINVDFPSNAFSVISKIMSVATFDIPKFNMETVSKVFTLPDNDSILDEPDEVNLKNSFELLGYSSAYMSNNLGSVFVIILVTSFLLSLSVILEAVRVPSVMKFNEKLKVKLHWNFVIRLVIEGYLELVFSVYFNLNYAKCTFSFLGSWVNYFYAIIFAVLIGLAPLFVVGFYSLNFAKIEDEEFINKFGSVYEGLKTNSRSVIVYTTIFLVRRALFALLTVLLHKFVIIELILTIILTMMMACYTLHFKPFEETLMNQLEAMNDTVTLLLIDLMFLFTPIVDSNLFKYNLGFVFISLFAGCISVHLFFLFKDITLRTIQVIKTRRIQHLRVLTNSKRQGGSSQKGCSAFLKKVCFFILPEEPQNQETPVQQIDSSPARLIRRMSNISNLEIIEEVEEPLDSSSASIKLADQSVLDELNSSGPILKPRHLRNNQSCFQIDSIPQQLPSKTIPAKTRRNISVAVTQAPKVALKNFSAQQLGLQGVKIAVVNYGSKDIFEKTPVFPQSRSEENQENDEIEFEINSQNQTQPLQLNELT